MSTTVMIGSEYLPLHHKSKGFILKVPFGKLAWVTVSLPLLSFIFCVIWSILFHFDRATYTHCEVPNFLPSISAAIGLFSPQRHVWRIAIAIHAGPRLLVARMYYRYYQGVLYQWIHFMAAIACWLNVIENLALIGLSFISSAENYAVHEKCFVTFMITSELYMMLTCYLLRSMRRSPPDNIEARSLRIKYQLLAVNVISFAMAAYFFIRHNSYCEPGVTYMALAFARLNWNLLSRPQSKRILRAEFASIIISFRVKSALTVAKHNLCIPTRYSFQAKKAILRHHEG